MQWLTLRSKNERAAPEWARAVGVMPDGELFLPAAIGSDDEAAGAACAAFDGEPLVEHRGHMFLRAQWLRSEYRHARELIDRIEASFADGPMMVFDA